MSEVSTSAPAQPQTIAEVVASLVNPPAPSGALQTEPTEGDAAVSQPNPAEQPVETAPATEAAAPAETTEFEPIEDIQLDLDRLPIDSATPSAETQTQQEAQQQQSESENLIDALGQKMPRAEAEKVVGAFLSTERGRRMYADFKALRELEKPDSEGGIGFRPTAEDIVNFHRSYQQHSRFWDDFSSGDPQRQVSIIRELFTATPDGRRVDGADQLLATLPDVLVDADPQMYRQLATPVATHITNTMRQLALSATSDEDKARWVDAGNLVAHLFGLQVGGERQQPESEEVRQLRERLAQIEGTKQTEAQMAHQRSVQSAQGAFHKLMAMTLEADVKSGLSQIQDKADEVTYGSYLNDYRSKLGNHVRDYLRNETVQRELKRAIDTAAQTQNRAPLEAFVKRVRQSYTLKLNEIRKPYIEAVNRRVKTTADNAASKLQQAQQRTEPAQGGAAVASSVATSGSLPARNPGESQEDYIRRTVMQLAQPAA